MIKLVIYTGKSKHIKCLNKEIVQVLRENHPPEHQSMIPNQGKNFLGVSNNK